MRVAFTPFMGTAYRLGPRVPARPGTVEGKRTAPGGPEGRGFATTVFGEFPGARGVVRDGSRSRITFSAAGPSNHLLRTLNATFTLPLPGPGLAGGGLGTLAKHEPGRGESSAGGGGRLYEVIDPDLAYRDRTLPAYEMDGGPLPTKHGAPQG